ncbi:acetylserotonin O-methyltransferase-like [Glandiceps talaboti]
MAAATSTDVWCHIHSFLTSQAIISAHKLGVFDYLEGKDASSITEMSLALGSHKRATKQLLEFMVCLGYLGTKKSTDASSSTTSDDGEYLYFNTEVTRKHLTTNSPLTVTPILNLAGDIAYSRATALFPVISEGKEYYEANMERKFHWDKSTDENDKTRYLGAMKSYCQVWQIPAIIQSFDLSTFVSVCDLGGGTGDVAYALAKQYPHMQVTMFDLPQIIKLAEEKKPSDIPSNVALQRGDFFSDNLPLADLYILSNIIHDWPEHKADVILSNVFQAVNPGGAVLIVELFLDNGDEPENIQGHLYSMLMLAKFFGQQLSGKHMSDLLRKHGFVDVEIKKIPQSMTDCMIAKKPRKEKE